jgi:acyl-coenzyme A thioesterase PaaI-like protein
MADGHSWARQLGLAWSIEPPGLVATFLPGPDLRGRPGYLHGGLAATVLDEVMAGLGWALDSRHTVTATLSLKYRAPVPLDGRPVRAESWRDRAEARRVQRVFGRLVLADGTVAVEAEGLFVAVDADAGDE